MLDRKNLDTVSSKLQTPSRREADTPTPQPKEHEEDPNSQLTQS